eukprot:gene6044-6282_t
MVGDPLVTNMAALTNYPIQATYTSGQTVRFSVLLQVNHGGRFTFRLCDRRSNLDQACFNARTLLRADNNKPHWYITTGKWSSPTTPPPPTTISMDYRLPAGFTCPNGCTIQWEYYTYNTCLEPCPKEECGFYADRMNYIIPPKDQGPKSYCSQMPPSSPPEIFRNCADVLIIGGNSPGTPPPAHAPGLLLVAATVVRLLLATCAARQGNAAAARAAHCGSGCQSPFGLCNGVRASAAAASSAASQPAAAKARRRRSRRAGPTNTPAGSEIVPAVEAATATASGAVPDINNPAAAAVVQATASDLSTPDILGDIAAGAAAVNTTAATAPEALEAAVDTVVPSTDSMLAAAVSSPAAAAPMNTTTDGAAPVPEAVAGAMVAFNETMLVETASGPAPDLEAVMPSPGNSTTDASAP